MEDAIRAIEGRAFDVVEKDGSAADSSQFAGSWNQTGFGNYFSVTLHKILSDAHELKICQRSSKGSIACCRRVVQAVV
jgi:hypothetical protein